MLSNDCREYCRGFIARSFYRNRPAAAIEPSTPRRPRIERLRAHPPAARHPAGVRSRVNWRRGPRRSPGARPRPGRTVAGTVGRPPAARHGQRPPRTEAHPSARVFAVSAAPACPTRQKNSPTRTAPESPGHDAEAPTSPRSPARTWTRRPAAAACAAPPVAASHAPRRRLARRFSPHRSPADTPSRTPNRSRRAGTRATDASCRQRRPHQRRRGPRHDTSRAPHVSQRTRTGRAPAPDPGTADRRRSRAVDDLAAAAGGRIARSAGSAAGPQSYLPFRPLWPLRTPRRRSGAEPGSPGAAALQEPDRAPGIRSLRSSVQTNSEATMQKKWSGCADLPPRNRAGAVENLSTPPPQHPAPGKSRRDRLTSRSRRSNRA